jgi:uncharacterized membrane protein
MVGGIGVYILIMGIFRKVSMDTAFKAINNEAKMLTGIIYVCHALGTIRHFFNPEGLIFCSRM